MPPNRSKTAETDGGVVKLESSSDDEIGYEFFGIKFKTKIVWTNVAIFTILHLLAFNGVYALLRGRVKLSTFVFTYMLGLLSTLLGVTGGAHRLWTHRSFKAKWPLRFVMMICNSISLQNSIYVWVRDHRVHHKYSDTHADPHNVTRGFFFSHIGWLLMKKHPDVIRKGRGIDISDLEADPIVMFQKRYYWPLSVFLSYVLVPVCTSLMFGEDLWTMFVVAGAFRHLITLHCTWCVNSVAHLWGYKPYDKNIWPSESKFVVFISAGEGFHNYHHVFPYDYSASELAYFNFTTYLIDFFAYFGQVYDRKKVSEEAIRDRAMRTGETR